MDAKLRMKILTFKYLIIHKVKGKEMKKILLCCALFLQIVIAKPIIAVSIPMQEEFLRSLVGEEYEIVSLVKVGINPHDFEPKFSDIKKVNEAIAYFAIGIEFEEAWLMRFKAQNPKMQIYSLDKDIPKFIFKNNAQAHNLHEEHDHEEHHHENGDTHIWLSTKNAKIIAKNLYNALNQINPNANYKENYENLIASIENTDTTIQNTLKSVKKHQKFVVFHPMLGYFAKDYELEEIAIEIEGKSPKLKETAKVIEIIKTNHLPVIFAQPEFSSKTAEFIAKESGATLEYFSPLQTPWGENLINFAQNLKKSLEN